MGEIGIPRREFLYDIRFWEVRRIVRGYRNRDRLKHQLMAECAYAAMFAMRDPMGKTVRDYFPSIFPNDDEEEDGPLITQEDIDDLQAEMDAINAANAKQQVNP